MLHISKIVHQFVATTTVKNLTWRAFHCGGLKAIQYRSSQSSPSGAAFVAHFCYWQSARTFATRINHKASVPVKVKASPLGFQVSVPAPRPYTQLPTIAGQLVSVRGGVLGLYQMLNTSGLGQIAPRSIAI